MVTYDDIHDMYGVAPQLEYLHLLLMSILIGENQSEKFDFIITYIGWNRILRCHLKFLSPLFPISNLTI